MFEASSYRTYLLSPASSIAKTSTSFHCSTCLEGEEKPTRRSCHIIFHSLWIMPWQTGRTGTEEASFHLSQGGHPVALFLAQLYRSDGE